jgi:hypothetical protein
VIDTSVTAGFSELAADAAVLAGYAALGAASIAVFVLGIGLGVRFLRGQLTGLGRD